MTPTLIQPTRSRHFPPLMARAKHCRSAPECRGPPVGDDADADPTPMRSRPSSQVGGLITLSKGGGSVNVNDADPDPMNELQSLTKSGNIISLTGGGSVTDDVDDADADPNNELQVLSKSGNRITLSAGGSITDEFEDADANPTNEIQTLGWNPATNILSISQANQVDLEQPGRGSTYWKDHPFDCTMIRRMSMSGIRIVLLHFISGQQPWTSTPASHSIVCSPWQICPRGSGVTRPAMTKNSD